MNKWVKQKYKYDESVSPYLKNNLDHGKVNAILYKRCKFDLFKPIIGCFCWKQHLLRIKYDIFESLINKCCTDTDSILKWICDSMIEFNYTCQQQQQQQQQQQ